MNSTANEQARYLELDLKLRRYPASTRYPSSRRLSATSTGRGRPKIRRSTGSKLTLLTPYWQVLPVQAPTEVSASRTNLDSAAVHHHLGRAIRCVDGVHLVGRARGSGRHGLRSVFRACNRRRVRGPARGHIRRASVPSLPGRCAGYCLPTRRPSGSERSRCVGLSLARQRCRRTGLHRPPSSRQPQASGTDEGMLHGATRLSILSIGQNRRAPPSRNEKLTVNPPAWRHQDHRMSHSTSDPEGARSPPNRYPERAIRRHSLARISALICAHHEPRRHNPFRRA